MQNKKLMTIPILLTFILLITGFAYACWSETLYINGTVETGTLCAKFTSPITCIDSGPDWTCGDGFTNPEPMQRPDGKDIGKCTITNIGDKQFDVILDKVYPSYYTRVEFHIKNCGTIPMKIWRVNFTTPAGTISIYKNTYVKLDLDNDGLDDVEIQWNDGWYQNDPGDPAYEISFGIHVLQDAPEGTTGLAFTVEIELLNWNCDE